MISALMGIRRLLVVLALILGLLVIYASGALAVEQSTPEEPITAQAGCGPAPCWPTYSFGDTDEDVVTIQYLLRHRGFADFRPNDGYFGPLTRRAVKDFQRARALAVTGRVGARTWTKLVVPVRLGMQNNAAVRGLQVQLRDVYNYEVKVSGDFGRITRAAVRDFQRKHDLRVTGRVNKATWQALISDR
ncbi:MAG TPA: peptidoglycan-binding protein [Rubrobacteraceae bacterium]|nr:peptidoglycan-binding protein [Rubrobacteraceae bacterium]